MRFLKQFITAAVLVGAMASAPEAMAQRNRNSQAASVIVVDYGRVAESSDLGRNMTTQLTQIGQQMQQELQPEATAIQAEEQSLRTALQGMTNEQIRANRALNTRRDAFAQRFEQFRARQASMSRDLEYTRQVALTDFNRQVQPIIQQVMEARGAGAVLDVGGVYHFAPSVNVTDDVVQRLNQGARTMTVTRQAAPAPQQQQPAAGQ